MSEFYARREHADLDSKVETFKELKLTNPALEAQVMNAASPYHEIVDIVAKHEKMEKMQNIDEFEATTRAEIEATVRAEIKAEIEGKQQASCGRWVFWLRPRSMAFNIIWRGWPMTMGIVHSWQID